MCRSHIAFVIRVRANTFYLCCCPFCRSKFLQSLCAHTNPFGKAGKPISVNIFTKYNWLLLRNGRIYNTYSYMAWFLFVLFVFACRNIIILRLFVLSHSEDVAFIFVFEQNTSASMQYAFLSKCRDAHSVCNCPFPLIIQREETKKKIDQIRLW